MFARIIVTLIITSFTLLMAMTRGKKNEKVRRREGWSEAKAGAKRQLRLNILHILHNVLSLSLRSYHPLLSQSTVTVYLIGCGLPKKSMGWFHLTQLLTMEKVVVKGIVEPYFEGVCMDVPEEWKTFKKEMEGRGITFYKGK